MVAVKGKRTAAAVQAPGIWLLSWYQCIRHTKASRQIGDRSNGYMPDMRFDANDKVRLLRQLST